MSTETGVRPALILPTASRRMLGKEAQKTNIMVAKIVSEMVKTTLGPKGSSKMLVDATGTVTVTNDGAAILKKIRVVHPIAQLMVEIAKTQEMEAGDGTTTAVVLAGELLKRAEALLDKDIHPTIITKGYKIAEGEAKKVLNEMCRKIQITDEKTLREIVLTALNPKASGVAVKEHLTELALKAVKHVADLKESGELKVDKKNIRIEKQMGRSIEESEFVDGLVIPTDDRVSKTAGGPKIVDDAKIALINTQMMLKKTETDAKIEISSPEQLQSFYEEEEEVINTVVRAVVNAGANVVFNYKTIDDRANFLLARAGVLAAKTIPLFDLEFIGRATGGKVIYNLNDLNSKDLGLAQRVEIKKIGGKEFIFIEGCENRNAVTIFLRGGSEHVLDELERSMDDAISVLRDAFEDLAIVPGGGAFEIEAARRLRKFANTIGGKEQLAVKEYADALEMIPKVLAENAGLDVIDTILALRLEHENGNLSHGVDTSTGNSDMSKLGVVEPTRVKQQIITSATEIANMVLRVDDVIVVRPPPPRH